MFLLDIGYDGIILSLFGIIMFGIPILMIIIGFGIRPKYKKAANIILILAIIILTIGLGICGNILF